MFCKQNSLYTIFFCISLCVFQAMFAKTDKKSNLSRIKIFPHDVASLIAPAPQGDFGIDGEAMVIQTLIDERDIVFDIGANIGDWSECVLTHHASCTIYAFEPIPQIYNKYCVHFANKKNIKSYNIALSQKSGRATFTYYPKLSVLSSLYQRGADIEYRFGLIPDFIDVPTMGLDTFCFDNKIDHIDFLKIDTEGAELDILKGAGGLLSNQAISFIQFEYGGTYLDAHITLQEVLQVLAFYGYSVFKIFPDSLIHIDSWHDAFEDYYLSNFIAVAPRYAGFYSAMIS